MNGATEDTDTNDDIEEQELDFDMWEGQFEFVGPIYNDKKMTYPINGIKKPLNGEV